MSTKKKTYSAKEMIEALRDMDRQIIDGSDIFKQAADMIERTGLKNLLRVIERICAKCGHETTEDGCAFCISQRLHGLPPIVCLCGSTRFYKTFQEQSLRLSKEGKIVLSIGAATASDSEHLANGTITEEDKARFDELHMRKIDLADEILVLNVGGYIGSSTRNEINHAQKQGKTIRYLTPIDLAGTGRCG